MFVIFERECLSLFEKIALALEVVILHQTFQISQKKRPGLFHNQKAIFAEALNEIIMLDLQITHSSSEYQM